MPPNNPPTLDPLPDWSEIERTLSEVRLINVVDHCTDGGQEAHEQGCERVQLLVRDTLKRLFFTDVDSFKILQGFLRHESQSPDGIVRTSDLAAFTGISKKTLIERILNHLSNAYLFDISALAESPEQNRDWEIRRKAATEKAPQ